MQLLSANRAAVAVGPPPPAVALSSTGVQPHPRDDACGASFRGRPRRRGLSSASASVAPPPNAPPVSPSKEEEAAADACT